MMNRLSAVFLANLLLPGTLFAEDCMVCDPEIVITPILARCFLDQAKATLDEMQRQNLPYQLVNLGTCEGISGGNRGPQAMPDSSRQIFSWSDIRNARSGTPSEPTTTFILDRAGLVCLDAAIRSNPDEFAPAAAFRPAEMCPP